jgi:hypothetical protein
MFTNLHTFINAYTIQTHAGVKAQKHSLSLFLFLFLPFSLSLALSLSLSLQTFSKPSPEFGSHLISLISFALALDAVSSSASTLSAANTCANAPDGPKHRTPKCTKTHTQTKYQRIQCRNLFLLYKNVEITGGNARIIRVSNSKKNNSTQDGEHSGRRFLEALIHCSLRPHTLVAEGPIH